MEPLPGSRTGKVIGIDDETRWALEELIEEMYDEEDNQSITLEELLQQREDIQDWRKDARAKERLLRWLDAHDIEPST